MKKYIWALSYALVLLLFTSFVLFDTFISTQVYTVVEDRQQEENDNQSQKEEQADIASGIEEDTGSSSSVVPDLSYTDENISITITEYREYDSSIYVADIRLSSSAYLQTAFAQNAYGKNITEKTSEIAENNSAILAINGDYYGTQENGFVVRNGVLYRNTASRNQEDLVIYKDGSFEVITEKETDVEALVAGGAQQILSFGPALVVDGVISVTEDEEVGKARASNPRTAIGIVDELHYLFVVSDGRTDESEGLSLYELAEFIETLGASIAYNLDGGGSSTMYFNGEIINNPTTSGKIKERSVSDIVYIGY